MYNKKGHEVLVFIGSVFVGSDKKLKLSVRFVIGSVKTHLIFSDGVEVFSQGSVERV